jgi:hypothetical protein
MRAAPLRPAITTPTCTVGITAFTTPTCTVGITAFTTPTCTVGITAFCPSGGQSRLRLTVIFYPPSSKARKTLWAGSDPRVSALLLAPRSSGPLLAAPSWMEQHACYGLADRKQVALLGTRPQTSRVFWQERPAHGKKRDLLAVVRRSRHAAPPEAITADSLRQSIKDRFCR